MNRSLSLNILIIPYEISLLPPIAEEPIHITPAEVVGAVEPIRSENPNLEKHNFAFTIGVQGVVKGSAVVPFEIVGEFGELVLDDVEVAAIGPVVPEVDYLEGSAAIYEED